MQAIEAMERKTTESLLVKAAYRKAQMRENGLTQETLADEFGVTQGLISHWLRGHTRIPDDALLLLSVRLRFDPVEVRPELTEKFALAKKVLTNEDQVEALRTKLGQLTEDELSQVELLAEMLVLRREREAKTQP